jgi:hypothetical protein
MVGSSISATAQRAWDALVREELGSAGAVAAVRAELVRRGLAVDGEPVCRVLRPHFLTAAQSDEVERVGATLAEAITRVARAARAGHRAGLQEWMAPLLEAEGDGAATASSALRFDAFLARTHLHYVELNADSPGGAGHDQALGEFFAGLPVFDRFAARYGARPQRPLAGLFNTLLGAWRRAGGEGTPTVAVMTRLDGSAHVADAEIEIAHLRAAGMPGVVADPAGLTFAEGRLRAGDVAVDVVHRLLPTGACVALGGTLHPLLAALRARAVVMVNPFHAELVGHKALFALLSDPASHDLLSADERAVVRRHVPWTRVLERGLLPDVLARRERLVLKPAHGFGGHGVTLGWHVDDAAWRAELEAALQGEQHVVQERVPNHRVAYPALEPGLPDRRFYEDADPFLYDGRVTAVLTRLSETEITNVRLRSGGGVVPTVVLDG